MIRSPFVPALLLVAFAFIFSSQTFAQDRAELKRKIEALRAELKTQEKEYLEPSKEDKAAYATFLSQPDTGLIRLMPKEDFQDEIAIRGGGAYYSFSHRTHQYGYGSDIQYEQDKFSVGFMGAHFGFLINLGEVSVDAIKSEHSALDFLLNFAPPAELPKAREQQYKSATGFQINEHSYRDRLDARVNTTYALRSINYGYTDVLVAFQVIRKDVDGSLLLAWKLLKKFPTPELARP